MAKKRTFKRAFKQATVQQELHYNVLQCERCGELFFRSKTMARRNNWIGNQIVCPDCALDAEIEYNRGEAAKHGH